VDRFARVVLGYHGCSARFADSILGGRLGIDDWKQSENPYDWLGRGIYFWEYAPERARVWPKGRATGGVIGAVIQLGRCLDFTDTQFTDLLRTRYEAVARTYREKGAVLPTNRGKARELDCLMINELTRQPDVPGDFFQTARSPFLEGEAAFPGSGILRESHIQIAVIDRQCILGVFRPNLRR